MWKHKRTVTYLALSLAAVEVEAVPANAPASGELAKGRSERLVGPAGAFEASCEHDANATSNVRCGCQRRTGRGTCGRIKPRIVRSKHVSA
jgi:hypothetical protein